MDIQKLWESDLDENDIKRYSRQIILPKVKIDGQKALGNAKVLVIGLGGLGSPVLMYLATTGIRTIGIVDYDRVELHNLQRQVIHSESTVGEYKTSSARFYISKLNSSINIVEHNKYLNSENIMEIIKEYDIIADCCDSIQLRYIINDACRILEKDLVSASVLRWEGQICVARRKGACYRCMFPEMKATAPNCATSGVLGPICGVIGSLQATEIVKLILNGTEEKNIDENIGEFIVFNGFSNFYKNFRKNFEICEVCKTKTMKENVPAQCGIENGALTEILPWSKIIGCLKDYLIVDIRKDEHFRMFRVAGSLNMPEIEKEIETIKRFYKPVVVSCYKGKSSLKAADLLRSKGIEAYSSDGGIEGFKEHIGFK